MERVGLGVARSEVAAIEKSSIELLAICHTYKGGEHMPSWIDLFLLYHISQATVKNNSKSWRDSRKRINMAKLGKIQ